MFAFILESDLAQMILYPYPLTFPKPKIKFQLLIPQISAWFFSCNMSVLGRLIRHTINLKPKGGGAPRERSECTCTVISKSLTCTRELITCGMWHCVYLYLSLPLSLCQLNASRHIQDHIC